MLNLLYVGSVSACLELDNSSPYYSGENRRVTLNGEELFSRTETSFRSIR